MADLLECLVQIRALRDTVARLERLVAATPPEAWTACQPGAPAAVEALAGLADAEIHFATSIRLLLSGGERLPEAPDARRLAERSGYLAWAPAQALGRFRTRRHENLELLTTCSADDLNLAASRPHGGAVTVADLVAVMLANDTEMIGAIRGLLGAGERR